MRNNSYEVLDYIHNNYTETASDYLRRCVADYQERQDVPFSFDVHLTLGSVVAENEEDEENVTSSKNDLHFKDIESSCAIRFDVTIYNDEIDKIDFSFPVMIPNSESLETLKELDILDTIDYGLNKIVTILDD